MAFRQTAMALVAVALTAAAGCSAHRRDVGRAEETPSSPTLASSDATKANPAAGRITEAAFNEDSDGARVVISSDAPLLYTSYEPRPDLLVFDFPGVALAESFTSPPVSGTLVHSIRIEPITELGKTITRMSIAHAEGAVYQIGSIGEGLAVAFAAAGSTSAGPPAETPAGAALEPAATDIREEPVVAVSVPIGEPAHALEEIVAEPMGTGVAISLLGDGSFFPKDFVLANPPRIVVDLPGVKNEVSRRSIPVNGDLVSRVRVSQFQTTPELVTRVVVDLARPAPHVLEPDGERLSIRVGDGSLAWAPEGEPVPSRTTLAAASVTAPASVTSAPADVVPAESSKAAEAEASPASDTKSFESEAEPAPASLSEESDGAAAPPFAAPATAVAAPVADPIFVSTEPKKSEPLAATQPIAVSSDPGKAPGEAVRAVPPPPPAAETASRTGVTPPASTRLPEPAPAAARRAGGKTPPSRGEALFEAAAAMLAQEEPARLGGAEAYQSRTITEAQTQFTGEPISLDLKDADIKDVFRTISDLTGLNIVVDPEVRGTVTVKLEDVAWDQALDLILKQNGLGYVLENNIMRIATSAKLQAEQGDRARLAEARQAAEPTRTVIKKLSYARATDITPTLKSVMSRRGDIVVDPRTNTLIIREIPTYLPAVMQLIENLDTSTPQVMIESRIVETTKTLGRSLGINWGFDAVADVAHGNTTGLIFPNNVDTSFRVPLEAGPTIGAIRLGNILDTFNLDIALTAAENQGLLKIISSPKVAALTNTAALIQSGVQIPVQTNVNNTTTVVYVDATLRLQVTPQITAEGTILLDVNVQKREPAVALNISLGQNVPLRIQEYRGQILVRDGGTTVIGGIFQINDQDQNNMIPGLWKIPILGNLFRNKTTTLRHDELLIFITPRILR